MGINIFYTGITKPSFSKNENEKELLFSHFPTIKVYFRPKLEDLEAKLSLWKNPGVVFFSKNGVLGAQNWFSSSWWKEREDAKAIWTIGEATAQVFQEVFACSSQVPEISHAKGLIQAFQNRPKQPFILFSALRSRVEFPQWLKQNGWKFKSIPVYETIVWENQELSQAFSNTSQEYIVFTSPSTVKGFLLTCQKKDFSQIKACLCSIGPTTSQEIEARKGKVFYQAKKPKLNFFLEEIIYQIKQSRNYDS